MSTIPYSKDLRKKVMEYLKGGRSQKEASEVFGIHRNTISIWKIRYKKEGIYDSRRRLGNRSKIDYEKLEAFVNANPNVKLSEVGSKFGISGWHAGRLMRRLGFSYKKKPLPTWKQTMREEKLT